MSEVIDTQRAGFTVIWKVENFTYARQGIGQSIKSPIFTVDILQKTKWYLELCPRGSSELSSDTIACYPVKYASEPFGHYLDQELCFLCADGSQEATVVGKNLWIKQSASSGKRIHVKSNEIFGKRRNNLLPGDTLTIQCKMWNPNKVSSEPGLLLARTRIGIERNSSVWTIDKFSTLLTEHQETIKLESSSDQFEPLTLTMFMSGGSTCSQKMQIKVERNDGEKYNFTTLNISVLDTNGKAAFQVHDEYLFEPTEGLQIWRFLLFVEKDQLLAAKDTLLPNDVLTLKCDFAVAVGTISNQTERVTYGESATSGLKTLLKMRNNSLNLESGENIIKSFSLVDDLRNLFEEENLVDMKVKVSNEIFSAHKAILSARSPVFKAMFKNEMKENITKSIDIDGLSKDTVRRMLLYFYTDVIEDIQWETASQLYMAADKYAVLSLKKRCSTVLKDSLCTENACELLLLSDLHQDKDLKSHVQDFIQIHDKEIIGSNEWKWLEQKNSSLALETFLHMYRSIKGF